jgi:crossover junction endodeoxyribonuclease RuvC
MRILGLDPGLEHTGWGVIDIKNGKQIYVASGAIKTRKADSTPARLTTLAADLTEVMRTFNPAHAAVEEVFVNVNAKSSLLLGQARGISLLVPQQHGAQVFEYATRLVKKTVVGKGAAEKAQVQHMVKVLLPTCNPQSADESDALAVAITHAHHGA